MSKEKSDGVKLLKQVFTGMVIGFGLTIVFYFINKFTINFDIVVEYSLFIQIAVILLFFIPTYFWMQKAKQHFSQIDETIDADDDPHREKAKQMLFRAMLFNRLFIILSFIGVGFAFDFDNPYFLISILAFLVIIFPGAMNEVKIFRMIQANDPMKKGDPTSLKFNKDYFSSLDEGEKTQVYQIAYHTYIFMEYALMGLLTLAIGAKIYLDVGNGPIIIIGLIWLLQSSVYFYHSKKFSKSETTL